VLVDMSVVSVMAAYSDLLCVCVVHCAGRYCQYLPARWTTYTHNRSEA